MTKHFSLAEITRSQTAARLGIDNSLPNGMTEYWAKGLQYLETIREFINAPIYITSGYRCHQLNTIIPGSSGTSHHMGRVTANPMSPSPNDPYCCAFDMETPVGNSALFNTIRNLPQIPFDQLIWEYGTDTEPDWVHVGFVFTPNPRRQILRKRVGKPYEAIA